MGGKWIFGWKPDNFAWNKTKVWTQKKKKNYNNKERVLIHLQVGDRQTEGLDAL